MKAIHSLLTLSVLASASGVHASTISTFTADETATSVTYKSTLNLLDPTRAHSTTGSPVSTASLDDSGVLTINIFNFHFYSSVFTDSFTNSIITLNGTWNGTTFTATSGSETKTGCTNGPNDGTNHTCSSVTLNTPVAFKTVSGSATAFSSGNFTLSLTEGNGTKSDYSLMLSDNTCFLDEVCPPPGAVMPIPSTAWLFGSGVMGLTSFARRRRVI